MQIRSPNVSRNGSPSPARKNSPRPPPNDTSERCFLVSNLHKQTLAETVEYVFSRYGEISRVDLNKDDNETPDGTAVVLFRKRPFTLEFLKRPPTVDQRPVKVEVLVDHQNPDNFFHEARKTRKSRMSADSLSFGVMLDMRTFVNEWHTTEDIAMVIDYDRRRIQIFFSYSRERYRLEFSFKDLANNVIKLERAETAAFFTMHLKYPARFWIFNMNAVKKTKISFTRGSWERVIDIPLMVGSSSPDQQQQPSKRKPLMPVGEPNKARLGMWTTYRIQFPRNQRTQYYFEKMLEEAAEYNLVPRDTRFLLPIYRVVDAASLPKPRDHIGRAHLPFDVLYMLESAILSYQFVEYNLDEHFYDTISRLEPDVVLGILDILIANKKRVWNPLEEIEDIFEKKGMKVCQRRKIPNHCAMIRKIIITPTTMYLLPPTVETTNRVVRHFHEHADRFIRVQFVDEGQSRISASHSGLGNDAVYNRIFKVLQNGIQIGTRRYEFLAFSSSQLREHGCWFFAPTPNLNANQIRNWMGSFSHEKIVAKHAVRMGQCFSSTRPITRLEKDEVEFIDDVVRNGYTFSDGVGKISPALAREVAVSMDLKVVPSAFQFRFGGAKGVLTVSNFLEGRKIQLRPSQIKFESDHYMLEVIRVSTLIPGYLNRQAITILSSLGVPDEVFMEKMEHMISAMNKMLGNPNEAIRTLMSNVDEFGTARSMARIIQAGFLEKADPYIVNLVNMFRVSMLKDLKKKAKIHVPKGAFLLGVMDETNTLQEGEVFCQISMPASTEGGGSSAKRVITGDTVVFRNPCFHPGDIRVVKAVDYPQLHHLCDVLVFSSQGFRDIPSMCSGGDLDGDDYTIFWDPDLLPKIRNYEPMDYKAEKPLKVDEVTISHIRKFFVNYINNDNLGQIANAHLATADRSSKGALDGACLRLAQLHSMAVDFPKSGKPAKMEEDLRVSVFPDFMQKKDKEMYISQKVLGKIYRAIDKADYKDYKDQLVDNTVYDVRLRVDGMERYVAKARKIKAEYNRDLLALMNQFGIQTEAEMVSGYIVKWLKKSNKKSMHEMQKQAMVSVSNMRAMYRRRFDSEFFGLPSSETHAAIEAKAAAWYYVTYHPEERQRTLGEEGKFLSFPWVVDEYLCEIARKNNNRVPKAEQAQALDDSIVEQFGLAEENALRYSIQVDSSEDEEEDEEDDEDEDSADEVKLDLSLNGPVAVVAKGPRTNGTSKQQQQQQQQPKPSFSPFPPPAPLQQQNQTQHFIVSASATDQDLMKALLE